MPITKAQDQVPGVPEEIAAMQERIDQLEKENRELREAQAGNIPQVSSASLHNYPDAQVKRSPEPEPDPKPQQPRTGASALATEK